MGTLRVIVEGLALWVPATVDGQKIWRVLFPMKAGVNPQHEPRLTVCVGGRPIKHLPGPIDLRHRVVKLCGAQLPLAVPEEVAFKFERREATTGEGTNPEWLLPLRAHIDSPVRHRRPYESRQVIAALTLPRGVLTSYSGREEWYNPVHFKGGHVGLDFASVVWFSDVHTDSSLVFSNKADGATEDVVLLPTEREHVSVIVGNRTLPEHRRPGAPTNPHVPIDETRDLLALTGDDADPPIYVGGTLPDPPKHVEPPCTLADTSLRTRSVALRRATPFRLCPQGYCEDCSGD